MVYLPPVTDLLELVKGTGGDFETGESFNVGKRDRETKTERMQITDKTIS